MCYSAQIWADYRRYVRQFGADIDLHAFYDLFWRRVTDPKIRIPKAMEMPFRDETDGVGSQIREAIETFAAAETTKLEQAVFEQRRRLVDAERTLQAKPTKAAANSQRIATDKIAWAMGKLSDLRRVEPVDEDSRIFPGHYAPVMVMEHGRRVIKPMRYQCRPAGKPVFHDVKFPGTYNARRDSLGGYWKELFGHSHGIVVTQAFYENVKRHRKEGRGLGEGEAEENVILEFRPTAAEDMLVACLWSRWTMAGEPDLLSFAAITDEPPAEVAAAGHDRCIVPIKANKVNSWLSPNSKDLATQYTILDDRDRPYYKHRLALETR